MSLFPPVELADVTRFQIYSMQTTQTPPPEDCRMTSVNSGAQVGVTQFTSICGHEFSALDRFTLND